MEWTQFVIFCVGVFGLFVWNRTESRADIRHMDTKLESNRNLSIQIHKENQDLINSIREEIRDFHVKLALQDQEFKMRLCAIEEKRNK